jgi:hypothetical protein
VVPGIDAVRSLYSLGHRVGLAISLLAGYGILALVDRQAPRRAVAIAALASVGILATRMIDPLARASFGRSLALAAWDARPDAREIALVRSSGPGAILHVPLPWVEQGFAYDGAHNLLLASYGPRDSADCYNSFPSPAQKQVWLLGRDLPRRPAAQALAALGFETALLRADWEGAPGFRAAVRSGGALSERASSGAHVAYAIGPPGPVSRDFGLLRQEPSDPASNAIPRFLVQAPTARIPFSIQNRGPETFRHPEPLAPDELIVRWSAVGSGDGIRDSRVRALLPIALGPGETMSLDIETPVPDEPGRYVASLRRTEAPDEVLAHRDVEVLAERPSDARPAGTLGALEPADGGEPLAVGGPQTRLYFTVRNRGRQRYEATKPGALVSLRLLWLGSAGRVVAREAVQAYVPPRISPGTRVSIELPALVPPAGSYLAVLIANQELPHVIGLRRVEVAYSPWENPDPTEAPTRR